MALMRSRLRIAWQPGLHLPVLSVIAYLIWLIAAPPSLLGSIVGLLGGLAARLAAALALLTAARRLHGAPTEPAWRTFGVGATLWAVGAGVALVVRLASAGLLPLPALADWIGLAGSLAALTGIASYRQRMPERFSRVRELLDIAILALAVAALAWLVFIRSALAVGLGGPIHVLWAAMAPAIDLVLVGLLVRLSLRSEDKNEMTVFGLLAFAVVILTASDLGDGYRRLFGDASPGSLIEAGWMAAGLLMVFAAQKTADRACRRMGPAAGPPEGRPSAGNAAADCVHLRGRRHGHPRLVAVEAGGLVHAGRGRRAEPALDGAAGCDHRPGGNAAIRRPRQHLGRPFFHLR